MSTPIMNLIVMFESNNKEYSPVYIAEVFWLQQIAQVKSVTVSNNNDCALVEIGSWYDTEVAYEFIRSLRKTQRLDGYDTQLVHYTDLKWGVLNVWSVRSTEYVPPSLFGRYTEEFPERFFIEDEPEEDEEMDAEDFYFHPDLYNVALECCENVLVE